MEIALENVPAVVGKVYVCPDVSGSMRSHMTGYRQGASTAVQCVDVAALVAAAILHHNPTAEVLPFENDVVQVDLNRRDTVMTNAARLAVGGGGTNCSAPVCLINKRRETGDVIVFISDNQSWVDASNGPGTALMQTWGEFRQQNADARLICIDIQPGSPTQVTERQDIQNIGGFSDHVFEVIAAFSAGELEPDHWVAAIEAVAV
jgi:60 kDa SS-A/Ro ribonucleoprotein